MIKLEEGIIDEFFEDWCIGDIEDNVTIRELVMSNVKTAVIDFLSEIEIHVDVGGVSLIETINWDTVTSLSWDEIGGYREKEEGWPEQAQRGFEDC
jgi:hypothetical protein